MKRIKTPPSKFGILTELHASIFKELVTNRLREDILWELQLKTNPFNFD